MGKICCLLNKVLLKMGKILFTKKQTIDLGKVGRYIEEVDKYIKNYENQITKNNAEQAVSEFREEWFVTINCIKGDQTNDINSKYGKALTIFSKAIGSLPNLTKKDVFGLKGKIYSFDKEGETKYKLDNKAALFLNLGLCWHKLGDSYRYEAIESFKRYIYYWLIQSFNTAYHPEAYAFRKCNNYLYQSLINEELNLSSPKVFNDPFDCPILELLNNEDEVALLIREAYHSCLKIACFMSNKEIPFGKTGDSINNEKHLNNKEEFLNPLMWAHYADNHSGICIKYGFSKSITQLSGNNSSVVSFFQGVKYSEEDLSQYSQKNSISPKDAFFLKGKPWEYENELRFLYFDIKGEGEHVQIGIKNCIEAIYFGVRCSEKDQKTIKRILKNKEFVKEGIDGKIIEDIEFYKMEIDKSNFGQLKAIKI